MQSMVYSLLFSCAMQPQALFDEWSLAAHDLNRCDEVAGINQESAPTMVPIVRRMVRSFCKSRPYTGTQLCLDSLGSFSTMLQNTVSMYRGPELSAFQTLGIRHCRRWSNNWHSTDNNSELKQREGRREETQLKLL